MLDFLQSLKNNNHDVISFFAGDKKDSISVTGQSYAEPGEPVVGGMGNIYHIVLMKDHKTNKEKYTNFDCFEAVLVEPLEYISDRIPEGWYGLVARKTSTSQKFIDSAVDKIKTLL